MRDIGKFRCCHDHCFTERRFSRSGPLNEWAKVTHNAENECTVLSQFDHLTFMFRSSQEHPGFAGRFFFR